MDGAGKSWDTLHDFIALNRVDAFVVGELVDVAGLPLTGTGSLVSENQSTLVVNLSRNAPQKPRRWRSLWKSKPNQSNIDGLCCGGSTQGQTERRVPVEEGEGGRTPHYVRRGDNTCCVRQCLRQGVIHVEHQVADVHANPTSGW